MSPEQERAALIERASAVIAGYGPDVSEWRLGEMTQRHYRFGATLADRGDRVLVEPVGMPSSETTVYAERLHVVISVRNEKVRVIL